MRSAQSLFKTVSINLPLTIAKEEKEKMLPKDKARRNLVLCTDGSDAAYKAFEVRASS